MTTRAWCNTLVSILLFAAMGVAASSDASAQSAAASASAHASASTSAAPGQIYFAPATFPSELADLMGKPVSQCRSRLALLGVSHAEGSDVVSLVARHEANLDPDPDTEIVAEIVIRPPEDESNPAMDFVVSHTLVWLDLSAGRLSVVGSQTWDVENACGGGGEFEVKTDRIHNARFDDVIVGSKSLEGGCTSQYILVKDEVVTMARGRVEKLLTFYDHAGCGVVRGVCVAPARVQLAGAVPKLARVVDEKGAVKSTRRFDAKAYRYQ